MLIRMHAIVMASALGVLLSAPLAVADTPTPTVRTAAQQQLEDRLDSFERDAASMRTDLDRYAASMRNPAASARLHAYSLNDAKDQVNSLGRQLDVLEELSPRGTELQQSAIREARSHLEAVANQLQLAIGLHNDDRRNVKSADYRAVVTELHELADDLYVKVDAITDYEKARNQAIETSVLTSPDDV
jgi:hypothetical protein